MDPVIFAKLCQKKQAEELFAAGVEGLAYCPKCGWINVCDPNDKLFRCANPDCLKETCRQCKGDNHIPQRCEEVENDEELKNRKILEEKMSEAMIRQCYNCKTPYFKTQGCNHMTCPKCKKEMCYVCKKPYRSPNINSPRFFKTYWVPKSLKLNFIWPKDASFERDCLHLGHCTGNVKKTTNAIHLEETLINYMPMRSKRLLKKLRKSWVKVPN